MNLRIGPDHLATGLAFVYALDRLLKMAAVAHFFRRPAPPAPQSWPSLSLIQPITRSTGDLSRMLAARARLVYPGGLEHVFACDAADDGSRALCEAWMAAHPERQSVLVPVESGQAQLASKVRKLQAALPHARGDVLCFVDDDILLRPDALTVLVPYLFQPALGSLPNAPRCGKLEACRALALGSLPNVPRCGKLCPGTGHRPGDGVASGVKACRAQAVSSPPSAPRCGKLEACRAREIGAVFGLACYVDWHNRWSGLMSAFVNANALLSYIPLTYLTDPFTITGHCYALRREVFMAIGGFDGMDADRVDDDHELARRVSAAGLRSCQTPLVYDVENSLDSLHAYRAQMRRWFVLPRQAMLPGLSPLEQALVFGASAAGLVPPVLVLLALLSRRGSVWRALALTLGLGLAVYLFGEAIYLRRRTPLHRLPLVLLSALLAPLEIVAALFGGDDFEWRGQRLRMQRGGRVRQASLRHAQGSGL